MIKRCFLCFSLLAALVICGSALQAQQAAPAGPEKVMIFNGEFLKVQLTGFIRVDAIWNTTNVAPESGPLVVGARYVALGLGTTYFGTTLANPIPGPAQGQPLMTNLKWALWMPQFPSRTAGSLIFDVRWTQLGLNITGPGVLGATTTARIEFDFMGTTPAPSALAAGNTYTAANIGARQGIVRMRLAWAKLAWEYGMGGTYVTFGQFNTLVQQVYSTPITLNPYPFFQHGYKFDWSQGIILAQKIGKPIVNVLIEAAMVRNKAGNDTGLATDMYPGVNYFTAEERGPGEATKRPRWEGRVSLNVNPSPMFSLIVGVDAHVGWEKQAFTYTRWGSYATGGLYAVASAADQTVMGANFPKQVVTKSIGAFATLQIAMIRIVAAGYNGFNMDCFSADLAQAQVENLAGTKFIPINTKGGYVQVGALLRAIGIPLTLSVGYGYVQKMNNKLITAQQLLKNYEVQGYLAWHLNNYLTWAAEITGAGSKYKARLGWDKDMMYRTSMQFIF
jgi:hypothetical protein